MEKVAFIQIGFRGRFGFVFFSSARVKFLNMRRPTSHRRCVTNAVHRYGTE